MNLRMTNSKWTLTVLALVALGGFAIACESETGPDAPPRTNGCIDTDCGNGGASGTDAGSDAE